LHGFSEPLAKIDVFFGGGQNRERGGAMLTQRTPYIWGLLPLCHFWRKSIKKCDCESAQRQTDTCSDREKLDL